MKFLVNPDFEVRGVGETSTTLLAVPATTLKVAESVPAMPGAEACTVTEPATLPVMSCEVATPPLATTVRSGSPSTVPEPAVWSKSISPE